jgi:DNA-directed RNA polymerase specialized sigma24 family protein
MENATPNIPEEQPLADEHQESLAGSEQERRALHVCQEKMPKHWRETVQRAHSERQKLKSLAEKIDVSPDSL